MTLLQEKERLLDVKQNLAICKILHLWSTSVPDAMYHLGSMGMLTSGFLSSARSYAYIESLSGAGTIINFQQMEEARNYGLESAAKLPWMDISSVIDGDCWSEIFTATQEVAKKIKFF